MERKTSFTKKLLALALSLVVAVTFIPLLGDSVFATEEPDPNEDANVVLSETDDTTDPDQVDISLEEPADEDDVVDITEEDDSADVVDQAEATAEEVIEVEMPDESEAAEGSVTGECNLEQFGSFAAEDASGDLAIKATGAAGISNKHNYFGGTIKQTGTTVTVNASVAASLFRFDGLFVDGSEVYVNNYSVTGSSVNTTINMNNYATGYHTVFLIVACIDDVDYYDGNECLVSGTMGERVDVLGTRYLSSNKITAKPNYNGKFNYVYSSYFNYYPFSLTGNLSGGKLYMEYSANGGKTWKRTGAMQANAIKLYTDQGFKISGLAANKKYKTRIRYGEYVTYSTTYLGDGKSYFFSGPVRNTTTIKTGKKGKPAIKSVTAKAIKVKRHKHKVAGHYEWVGSSLIWIGPFTEKYYTYKIKITVKLKKKPGTAGIWINGKFAKGNKKKYVVTYTPYPNYSAKKPRGKKIKVQIKSYQNKGYGGFSSVYSKKKKLK